MGPAGDGVLQVHPTTRCNLRCRHCYSSSAPERRDALPATVFAAAIRGAREEAYRVASFSGGEPLLYGFLPELLRCAKELGMRTTVTTNGMLLHRRKVEAIAGLADLLAISLDGVPETHNWMRGSERAFADMVAGVAEVRACRLPFGFIFTLTQHNLHEAAWAAAFACEQGASLFQVHALEDVGRAREQMLGGAPDDLEAAYGYLEIERLRRAYEGRMVVHFDLVHVAALRLNPDRFFDRQPAFERPLAELVSPLVIEESGRVVPFGYGFDERFSLGSIAQESIAAMAARYRASGHSALQALCRRTFEEVLQPRDFPILNWWESLGQHASAKGAVL